MLYTYLSDQEKPKDEFFSRLLIVIELWLGVVQLGLIEWMIYEFTTPGSQYEDLKVSISSNFDNSSQFTFSDQSEEDEKKQAERLHKHFEEMADIQFLAVMNSFIARPSMQNTVRPTNDLETSSSSNSLMSSQMQLLASMDREDKSKELLNLEQFLAASLPVPKDLLSSKSYNSSDIK